MPSKAKKIGRLRIAAKNGRQYEFELIICDRRFAVEAQSADCEAHDCRRLRKAEPRAQDRPPVKEPPNEPQKPPVEEPGKPPAPPPPRKKPPVKEPPNEPDEPPIEEPPPKDPDREPPQKPPIRAGQVEQWLR
jgi:hypothetical protein